MGGKNARVSIPDRFETIVLHPFGKGNLTSDGVQYSATATAPNSYSTVESVTIPVPAAGDIKELELAVTWGQRCDGTVNKAVGKVQALDDSGSWVDVMTEKTNAVAGTAYEEWTYSGRLDTSGIDLEVVPFQLRVQVKSDGTTNNAVGRVKNSSYLAVTYDIQ